MIVSTYDITDMWYHIISIRYQIFYIIGSELWHHSSIISWWYHTHMISSVCNYDIIYTISYMISSWRRPACPHLRRGRVRWLVGSKPGEAGGTSALDTPQSLEHSTDPARRRREDHERDVWAVWRSGQGRRYPCRNLCRCQCGAARPRLSEPMPSPRRVIEPHTRPMLPVVAAMEAAKGFESMRSPFQIPLMKSQFLIGKYHTPTCQKKNHKAGNVKRRTELQKQRSENFGLSSSLLRRNPTQRISLEIS